MKITSCNVFKIPSPRNECLGFASITFDNCFVVHDLKIINGNNGLFVSMPSKLKQDKNNQERYMDIAHPITSSFRQEIEVAVINEFNKA